ncbi:MAG: hypothetical protein M3O15_08860, partial [Acidobacteriota bacterium]|nr:hypothetical protein [Acidobacteriota bacterium]
LERWALPAVLAAVLATQAVRAVGPIVYDLGHEMTSAKAFGRLLRTGWRDAIVMGEPDDALESLPYYAPNRIYIPRERRFGDWTRFTLANQPEMSLGEIVRAGMALRRATGKPVLLAFGHVFRGHRRLRFSHLGRRVFTWSDEDMALFRRETVPVAAFLDSATESYRIYSFR